ncbi:hypothetical protein P308_29650 [Pseudomonas piscis]|nr:hypothetical protein P308_29650 [Pseudomonas piscis]
MISPASHLMYDKAQLDLKELQLFPDSATTNTQCFPKGLPRVKAPILKKL